MAIDRDIEFRPLPEGQADAIVPLLAATFGERESNPRDESYWEWKHEQNPFGKSLMFGAWCGDQLVGARAFLRWEFNAAGETVRAMKPVDSVTHPDFQRRGIFSRLTQMAIDAAISEGCQLLVNTPNSNSLPGYLKLGWRKISDLPMRFAMTRPISMASRIVANRLGLLRNGQCTTGSHFRIAPQPAQHFEVNGSLNQKSEQFVTRRSTDYLDWRYSRHPHLAYFQEESNHARLIYRLNHRQGARELMLDDWLLPADDAKAHTLAVLLRRLRGRFRGDYIVTMPGRSAREDAVLKSFGCHSFRTGKVTLVCKPLSSDLPLDPTSPNDWALCLGDLEGL